ncbi:MAG: LPS export ABC transporter permease LptF [Thermodesulfobacteriota bacterium]|nr:LPS export ABC transporter permease LptF [Thermodesulfobacteriota bacterium]
MRFNIINRYIFRELLPPFAVSSLFLTFIFLMTRIPDITSMVVNYNTGLLSVVLLIFYTLPRFMEFTIPMSVMIAVLLIFMRMSSDNEIIALKGGGVSIYRLMPPVIIFSLLGTMLTMWITVWGVPWGKFSFEQKGFEIARANLNLALKERQFNNSFNNVMIYVSSINMKTKELKDIFIEDSRTESSVSISVAPRGVIIADPGQILYTMRLYNGTVNQVDLKTKAVNSIDFNTYDINLDLAAVMGRPDKNNKDLDEMNLKELMTFIKKNAENKDVVCSAKMELYEKFSVPFACLSLGLLAFPLGLQSASSRRSSGFGLAMFFFIVYYLLLAGGWSAGDAGIFPPVFCMWLADVVMGGAGIYLLVRIANERPVQLPLIFQRAGGAVKQILSKRRGR